MFSRKKLMVLIAKQNLEKMCCDDEEKKRAIKPVSNDTKETAV